MPFESFEGGIINDKYTFDANANVSCITDQLSNVSTRSMTYDGLDRLKSVVAPALWGNAAYGYDSLDNLTSTKLDIGGTKRTTVHNIDYTDSNHTGTYRLISTTGDPGYNFVYEYDALGNVKKRGAQAYVFDQANRLKSAIGKATYRYDGLGRRVSTVGSDGVNRIQVYAQNGPLLYLAPGSVSPTKYVYLKNHVLAEVTGTTVTYSHTDALGSPVAQTSAVGAVISRTRYEPYGYVAAGSPKTIGFTGHVNDNETGLIYMQQRYYDPLSGRLLSIDPMVTDANTGGSFNRCAYANNSPYKYVDPDGRNPAAIPAGVGGTFVCGPVCGGIAAGAVLIGGTYAGKKIVDWWNSRSEPKRSDSSVPPAPDTLVGEQGDMARPTKNGKRHTSGPLTPENGGTGDAKQDFDKLTGGSGKAPDSSDSRSSIPGVQVGDNGIWIRPDGKDGPRIEIPAAPGKLPETLHYPPEKK